MARVVLLQPPFFRFFGSHNDRIPLHLSYLAAYLVEAGHDPVVLNGDATITPVFWRWWHLYERQGWFDRAVDGESGLYGEMVERIMALKPDAVVIGAGDSLISTVDLGNPFVACNFADLLRRFGIFTVGVGSFFTVDGERFAGRLDALIVGEPGRNIVEVIEKRLTGIHCSTSMPLDVLPMIENHCPLDGRKDLVLSNIGCHWNCAFCISSKTVKCFREVPAEKVVADVQRRPPGKLYFADMVFPTKVGRLQELRDAFRVAGIEREFACESRVDTLDEERLPLMRDIGVRTVKIGVESINEQALRVMNKHSSKEKILRALDLLRRHEMKVVVYVLLGGPGLTPEMYEETYRFCQEIRADHYVVNIWAYDYREDYRYDTHFSMRLVDKWRIPQELVKKFCDLQPRENPTVGSLIGY